MLIKCSGYACHCIESCNHHKDGQDPNLVLMGETFPWVKEAQRNRTSKKCNPLKLILHSFWLHLDLDSSLVSSLVSTRKQHGISQPV